MLKNTRTINIEVSKELWKEFGMLCIQMDQTRKESLEQALQLFIRENKHTNVYSITKTNTK